MLTSSQIVNIKRGFILLILFGLVMACQPFKLSDEPLYEAIGTFNSSEANLRNVISRLSDSLDLPLRDTMTDLNGDEMYLLSNDSVVVTIEAFKPEFSQAQTKGLQLGPEAWVMSATARKAAARRSEQMAAVDRFTAQASDALKPLSIEWRTRN